MFEIFVPESYTIDNQSNLDICKKFDFHFSVVFIIYLTTKIPTAKQN